MTKTVRAEYQTQQEEPTANFRLPLSKRHDVADTIKRAGLDPSSFRFTDVESDYTGGAIVNRLVVQKDPYMFFQFDYIWNQSDFFAIYSPDSDALRFAGNVGKWANLMGRFTIWLDVVRRELNTPNVWEAFEHEFPEIEFGDLSEASNELIPIEARETVRQQLGEVRQYLLREHVHTDDHREFVEERLDDLADAVDRLGRVDWYDKAISVFIQIVFTLALSGEAANTAFRFMFESVKFIVRLKLGM